MMARASAAALARCGLVVAQGGPIVAGESARVFPPFTARERVNQSKQSTLDAALVAVLSAIAFGLNRLRRVPISVVARPSYYSLPLATKQTDVGALQSISSFNTTVTRLYRLDGRSVRSNI